MKKQSLLQGALLLSMVGFINRVLGFSLRIILVQIVGDEGLGLFQMVYPIYITLLLLSTAGFPLALSRLIPLSQEKNNNTDQLFKTCLYTLFITGTITSLILLGGARIISNKFLSDTRVYYPLLAISPALLFSTLASAFRGFFQGQQTMIPTAISQITEQISRIAATLIIITIITDLSLKYKAAGIAIGIGIGEAWGLIILIFLYYFFYQKKKKQSHSRVKKPSYIKSFKQLAKLGIPITMARLAHSLLKSAEAILIPGRLMLAGYTTAQATGLYGQLSGMVEQIIFLPTVITIGLTTSLIPKISREQARGNHQQIKNNYGDILRIITIMGFPLTLIFFRYGSKICQLLFGYGEAGILLSNLALSVTFIYYLQVSSGILHGLGKPVLSVRNLIIGGCVTLTLIYYLTAQPFWGITGTTLALTLGYILSALLNFTSIAHLIGWQININNIFIKPAIATGLLYLTLPYLEMISSFTPRVITGKNLSIIVTLFLSILVYLVILYLIRGIKNSDLKRFRS